MGHRKRCEESQRHHAARSQMEPRRGGFPGQRPGNPPPVNTALKGRDGTALPHAISVTGQVPPLRGGIRGGGPQGWRPGLSSCAPPGLHTDLIRSHPISSGLSLTLTTLACTPYRERLRHRFRSAFACECLLSLRETWIVHIIVPGVHEDQPAGIGDLPGEAVVGGEVARPKGDSVGRGEAMMNCEL